MRRKVCWVVLLCGAWPAAGVAAESFLTFYGIIDAALEIARYDRNVSQTRLQSGDLQATRFGIRGAEDLGAGWAAELNLEMGPSLDTGAAGAVLWNRGSSVGLRAPWGRVDIGKQYMPIFWITVRSEAATYGFANASALLSTEHAAVTGRSGVGGYNDNVLRYRSPTYQGLDMELAYSTGAELPGERRREAVAAGANLQYLNGPWWLGVACHRSTTRADSQPLDQVQRSALTGAKYSAGWGVVGANYLRTRNMQAGPNTGDARAVQLTVKLPLAGADLNLGAARLAEGAGRRTAAWHAGYVYFLSRGTQLYSYWSLAANDAAGNRGLANLSSDYRTVEPGFHPRALTLGLRTAF